MFVCLQYSADLKISIILRQKKGPSCSMMAVMIAIMSIFNCFFFSSVRSVGPNPITDPVQLGRPSEGSAIPNLGFIKMKILIIFGNFFFSVFLGIQRKSGKQNISEVVLVLRMAKHLRVKILFVNN